MTLKYLVRFGTRVKRVEVEYELGDENFYDCLVQGVRKVMLSDPLMRYHAKKDVFLCQQDESGISVELDSSTPSWTVDNKVPIELMLLESMVTELPVKQTAKTAEVPAQISNYLDSLGVHVHKEPQGQPAKPMESTSIQPPQNKKPSRKVPTSPQAPSPPPQNKKPSRTVLTSPQAVRTKKRDRSGSSSPEGEYMERILRQRKELRQQLQPLLPKVPSNVPKLRPETKKQGVKKGKENIEKRVMPRRAAKMANQKTPAAEPSDSDESLIFNEDENSEDLGPLSSGIHKKIVQIKVVGNFHKEKGHRKIGEIITKYTPLPEFPKELRKKLEKGIYDTVHMNSFLKGHIKEVTGGYVISKGEYKVLAEQVANRFQGMHLINAEGYMIKIKKKLSDSLRATRYYQKKKERRAAQRAAKRAQKKQCIQLEADAAQQREESLDEADVILQKPVVNKNSVKMCISASTTRIRYIKSHTVQQVLRKYPYLREADLLIFEYSTRAAMPLKHLEENFSKSLPQLAHILDKPELEDHNELEKIMIFYSIERFYSGGEEEHLPSIQFCDEAIKNASPLNNIPKGQAPAIVIARNDAEIRSATLIFDGDVLATAESPTAFQCVALLMSAYWVFHIEYPKPYMQHLESFEAILHNKVEEKARQVVRHSKMDEFLRKLIVARECSV